jgi:hypothetical protein
MAVMKDEDQGRSRMHAMFRAAVNSVGSSVSPPRMSMETEMALW